ncbi:MAG: hypothetical protein ACKV19_16180 [Verrucomicrobiales bacterium]
MTTTHATPSLTSRPTPRAIAPPIASRPEFRKLAIVIRDDAWDRLLTPLTFAWEMARRGVEVDVLFVLWAVRILSRDGVEDLRIDPRYAHREDWLRERLSRDGDPTSIHDFLRALKATGRVRLHACRLAAMTFDVTPANLLPEAKGIIDPSEFVTGIAATADHCQYF